MKQKKTRKISGIIKQIIKPEEHDNYFSNSFSRNIKGRFFIVVEDKNAPKGGLFNMFFIKPKYIHTIIMNTCNNRVGDLVEFNVIDVYEKSEFLTLCGEDNILKN